MLTHINSGRVETTQYLLYKDLSNLPSKSDSKVEYFKFFFLQTSTGVLSGTDFSQVGSKLVKFLFSIPPVTCASRGGL